MRKDTECSLMFLCVFNEEGSGSDFPALGAEVECLEVVPTRPLEASGYPSD